jgi:hypothetical protein
MVKHADRWPPAYYRAINQLADVIATFPPEKVPPFQLREITDDLEIALNRRHRAHYEALCHAGFAYHCVQERERRRNAGEPERAWRPRHVHVRSLKGGSNGRPASVPHLPPAEMPNVAPLVPHPAAHFVRAWQRIMFDYCCIG